MALNSSILVVFLKAKTTANDVLDGISLFWFCRWPYYHRTDLYNYISYRVIRWPLRQSRRQRSQFLRQRGLLHHRSSLNHSSLQNYRKCSDGAWSQSQNHFSFVTFNSSDSEKFWKSNNMLPKPKRGLLLKPHVTHFIFTINIFKKVTLKAKQM